jgi:hypothetical protein
MQVSGMGDFLGELAGMMSQETPTVSYRIHSDLGGLIDRAVWMQESFEDLQQLFADMFHGDLIGEFGFGGPPPKVHQAHSKPCTTGSSFARRRRHVKVSTSGAAHRR